MVEKGLTSFFEEYMNKKSFFLNKQVLQNDYTPEMIPHREKEMESLAGVLAPVLRLDKPSNIFIYGKTGTGKTLITQYVAYSLLETAKKKKIPMKLTYLNCKLKRISDTEYRLVAELAREFGEEVPATGLPTDEVYKIFLKVMDREKVLLIIVLDEIDQLVEKAGNEILYNLTRLNSELKNSRISFIGISNNLMFTDRLDPRVKSSLSEEELLFPPYNATQLLSILKDRSSLAFRSGSIQPGVLEKCAAYAAREHGDARRALDLLRVAGELAERKNETMIKIVHLDEADEKIERDRIYDVVNSQPKQHQLTLYSIFKLRELDSSRPVVTGDVYEIYKEICAQCKIRPLTPRRISDIIAEFDMMGIINAKVISHGRYGRTKEINITIPQSTTPGIYKLLQDVLL